jgi:hypothetical protein
MATGLGLFGLAHDLSGSYAASLSLCIGMQLMRSLIVLCAPWVVPSQSVRLTAASVG